MKRGSVSTRTLQKAYSDLVSWVFRAIRNGIYASPEELYDVADALHNANGVLADYGSWIEDEEYRRLYLQPFDSKWAHKTFSLEDYLKERIEHHQAKANGK